MKRLLLRANLRSHKALATGARFMTMGRAKPQEENEHGFLKYGIFATAATAYFTYKYVNSAKRAECEKGDDESDEQQKTKARTSIFEIPKLMKQSEISLKKELQDASESELMKLDQLSDSQIDSMKGFEDKEQEYIEQGGAKFRSIKVLEEDMLKNGMKVQVNICDPENKEIFHPYDKILLYRYGKKHYSTGSYCGFDFTDLNKGIYIGEKIICPTCGSTYNIKNGSVDQGPSMRNITAFPLRTRNGFVEAIVPDHIPAFSMREILKEEKMDPRTMVIIGDSEAALSAIITLRYSFVGKIFLIPTSPEGSFQNKDVLIRKFEPIDKEEVFYVEQDLFSKANIEVINSQISKIDCNKREITFKNSDKKISFESLLFAGGSRKEKGWKYSNVFVITDYDSHAKVYNEVLKSRHTCIQGSTFEAFQLAASIRKQLDRINFSNIKLTIFDENKSELEKTFGARVYQRFLKEFKDNKISVITDASVTRIEGENRLDKINFVIKGKGFKEYYIKPDVVVTEPDIGKVDHNIHETIFFAQPRWVPNIDSMNAFKIDKRFSIILNFINYGLLACGQNAVHRSFLGNPVVRTTDMKFNIESGFYAALNMINKEVKMEYIPLTRLTIGDKECYFYGERNQNHDSYHIEGDLDDDKFVVYYFRNGIICGFLTFGYTNVHLYFIEAMKYLIFPDEAFIRSKQECVKEIVNLVIEHTPEIKCVRNRMINERSVYMAVKDREVERAKVLRSNISQNFKEQDEEAKKQFKLKNEEQKKAIEKQISEDENKYVEDKQMEELKKRGLA